MSVVPAPGPHGGDSARVARALGVPASDVLDLSASLNPVAPDPVPLVARHLEALGRYPDSTAATSCLAAVMGVAPERVLLTNGGAEAISMVSAELGGRVVEPEFSLLPRGTGPVWRSDPHNPTGLLAGPHDRADVWDEAFYALSTGRWTAGRDAVVVGSLTKLFACPGLRLGYVLAPPGGAGAALVVRLRDRQPEWSVSGLAAAALPDMLHDADLPGWASRVRELRQALTQLLDEFGLSPLASDANFVLCATAPGLRERLAPQRVLVRDCTSFGLEGYARVAVPDERGLAKLAVALGSA